MGGPTPQLHTLPHTNSHARRSPQATHAQRVPSAAPRDPGSRATRSLSAPPLPYHTSPAIIIFSLPRPSTAAPGERLAPCLHCVVGHGPAQSSCAPMSSSHNDLMDSGGGLGGLLFMQSSEIPISNNRLYIDKSDREEYL